MTDLRGMLERKADEMELPPLPPAELLRRARRHRLRTGAVSLGLAAALGIGAYAGGQALFGGHPPLRREPAVMPTENDTRPHHGGPQYEFDHITVDMADNQRSVAVFYAFDFENHPGVHECTWRAIAADGSVVGERTLMFAPPKPSPQVDGLGVANNAVEMEAHGIPVRGEVSCGPRRLDTPNIARTAAYPGGLEREEAAEMIEERVHAWADRFEVEAMGERIKAANVEALEMAIGSVRGRTGGPQWLEVEELLARTVYLKRGDLERIRLDRV